VQQAVEASCELAQQAAQAEDPAGFNALLGAVVSNLSSLPPGGLALVPGGWKGTLSVGFLMHIVERSADGTSYAFTTANLGPGSEYHTAAPGPSRTYVAPCLRLEGLPGSRVLDPAFWANSLGLWARSEPSEFCRLEVVYDVLLPWLADHGEPSLLPTAHHAATHTTATTKMLHDGAGAAAPASTQEEKTSDEFRSASRSGAAGAWKASLEAARYILRRTGLFSKAWLKTFTLAVRCSFLARASQDLATVAALNQGVATQSFAPMTAKGAPTTPLPTVAEALASVAVLFPQMPAATALPTCGAVMAKLQPPPPSPAGAPPAPKPTLPDGVMEAVPVLGSGAQVLLLYFTKSDCPHCVDFTPVLKERLEALIAAQAPPTSTAAGVAGASADVAPSATPVPFSGVVVSLDGDAQGLGATLAACGANWACLPPSQEGANATNALATRFGVRSTPTLVVLNALAHTVINLNAVAHVRASRHLEAFPWRASPRWLTVTEEKMLGFARELTGLSAAKASEAGRLPQDGLLAVHDAVSLLDEQVTALASDSSQSLSMAERPPLLAPTQTAYVVPLPQASLLCAPSADAWAGAARAVTAPELPNFLAVPARAATTQEALQALKDAEQVVTVLMRRCAEGAVASQLALKLQAIALLTSLFTTVLPPPLPLDAAPNTSPFQASGTSVPLSTAPGAPAATTGAAVAPLVQTCVWRHGIALLGRDTQLSTLRQLHGLLLSLANLSQAVETPTRTSDASRALAGSCCLAIFDAVLRVKPLASKEDASNSSSSGGDNSGSNESKTSSAPAGAAGNGGGEDEKEEEEEPAWAPLAISELLSDDGGYALDQVKDVVWFNLHVCYSSFFSPFYCTRGPETSFISHFHWLLVC